MRELLMVVIVRQYPMIVTMLVMMLCVLHICIQVTS